MSPSEHLQDLVEAAAAAPSSHNTQPWLFSFDDPTVRVWADRTRALPVNDPRDRELTISCGAALENLVLAATARGLAPSVRLKPSETEPDLLAEVLLSEGPAAIGDEPLAAAINGRRTVRTAFREGTPDPSHLRSVLAEAETQSGVVAVEVATEQRTALADLASEGDRRQFDDPRWRRELAAWMHPRRSGDGLPVSAVAGPFTRLVVSTFDLGSSTAKKDHELALEAPALVVLGTERDGPSDWLRAGRALERLLLRAAALGYQAGYLNQPCQVDDLRAPLGELLLADGVSPQIVLRLGIAESAPQVKRRRAVEDMIVDDDELNLA
jgi:nitroreductase